MPKPPLLWIDRNFEFILPPELYPNVIERLRGTPVRLEELVGATSDEILTHKPEDGWSIKEHIGHLRMVDNLFDRRLTQFIEGAELLAAADMSNQATKEADFNAQPTARLLSDFRNFRANLVGRFDAVALSLAARTSHHPRLNKPMRLIDHAYFAAEHDDHHLAQITRLLLASR